MLSSEGASPVFHSYQLLNIRFLSSNSTTELAVLMLNPTVARAANKPLAPFLAAGSGEGARLNADRPLAFQMWRSN